MNEDQLKVLWDVYGSGQGFESYDEFKSLLQDDTNRKVFFDYSNEELGFTDYNEFEELLGIKKKRSFWTRLRSAYAEFTR